MPGEWHGIPPPGIRKIASGSRSGRGPGLTRRVVFGIIEFQHFQGIIGQIIQFQFSISLHHDAERLGDLTGLLVVFHEILGPVRRREQCPALQVIPGDV